MRNSALKYLLLGFIIVTTISSCVPLAVGAAGVAVGYIAREEGVGVVEPVESSGSSEAYDQPVY